ncbi:MAG: amino acid permease [Bacteroidetes bacterium]|nr:amino acid permease [Bacteroidota bacterium]
MNSDPRIKRELGIWTTTSIVVGNMIGSGIFLLPAALAVFGGLSIVGWLFTSAGAVLLALVFSRFSRMMPQTGGPYIYTKAGLGSFLGFLVAWGYWVSIWCANAAIAVAFVGYLAVFIPVLSTNYMLASLTALAAIWLLTIVNCMGVKKAGILQLVTTILKLVPLILISFFGLFYLNPDHFIPFNLSGESDFTAITATAALTLWAFLGLESGTIPAENIKNPEVTIPRATLWGTIITAVIYIGGTAAVMGIISPEILAKSTAPFADAAKIIFGDSAQYLVAAGAVISCFGALNGWILLQGQIPMAAARDKVFPLIFGRVSERGTPVIGLIGSSILVTLLISLNYTEGLVDKFTFIILLATLACLVPYFFVSLSQIVLLLRAKANTPRKELIKHIIIASLALLYSAWAIMGAGLEIIFWGTLLLIAGIPIYLNMKKK